MKFASPPLKHVSVSLFALAAISALPLSLQAAEEAKPAAPPAATSGTSQNAVFSDGFVKTLHEKGGYVKIGPGFYFADGVVVGDRDELGRNSEGGNCVGFAVNAGLYPFSGQFANVRTEFELGAYFDTKNGSDYFAVPLLLTSYWEFDPGLSEKFRIGFGPTLGLTIAKPTDTEAYFTFGLSTEASYKFTDNLIGSFGWRILGNQGFGSSAGSNVAHQLNFSLGWRF